ncbi:hypothetical protein m07a_02040 [Bartonella schoenbuchensis m07a]|uniref:Uncharacterized protein n=2 Tax=Bartonella schoenbuchensis TaxID=165694 RepID=N6UM95_9HYPH|nr:hypothetical protein m07a_02040 [Bartonella schoenbuchensis m07a]
MAKDWEILFLGYFHSAFKFHHHHLMQISIILENKILTNSNAVKQTRTNKILKKLGLLYFGIILEKYARQPIYSSREHLRGMIDNEKRGEYILNVLSRGYLIQTNKLYERNEITKNIITYTSWGKVNNPFPQQADLITLKLYPHFSLVCFTNSLQK